MKYVFIYVLFNIFYVVIPYPEPYRNLSCGVDKYNISMVYEGQANIRTYPWMGTLFYPMGKNIFSTAVVLVTRQIVLADANDIDMIPKHDMRARSRVVLGRRCNRPPSIKIRSYSFHPDFRRNTYSALAIVQLNVDISFQELLPICGPPSYLINPKFYAMTSSDNCQNGQIQIRKMRYVDTDRCKQFYNKSGLGEEKFWPNHVTCARALTGGRCMWRSGTILVVKQNGRWRLLGFSINGPGCEAPARFIDYGMHEDWVVRSIARIGQPAITRLGKNHLVLRRPLASVQRFGPCDPEETKYEMYTDMIRLLSDSNDGRVSYNLTLIHGVEYSCVIFKVEPVASDRGAVCSDENPKLHLRRWCAGPQAICHGFQFIEIHFFVQIEFEHQTKFSLAAYGKTPKILSPKKALQYINVLKERPKIKKYKPIWKRLKSKEWGTGEEASLKHFYLTYTEQNKTNPREDSWYLKMYRNLYKQRVRYQNGVNLPY